MNAKSVIVLFASFALHGGAVAQAYPAKVIRFVVPFAAGGGSDILARTVGPKWGEVLGQSVVIDNRPGGGGSIAVEYVSRATPDGYTLLMGFPGLATYASLYGKPNFDPTKDLAPVGLLGTVPDVVVVHPSVPAQTVAQLVALARAHPGRLNYASPGKGSGLHLAAELFKAVAKIDVAHIAYKGGGPAVVDLIGGHVDMMIDVLPSSMPYIQAGKLRALGIADSKRSPLLPDVPTVRESGLPGYQAITWNGILAPGGTPRDIIAKLNAAITNVLNTPEMKQRFAAIATDPAPGSPEQFSVFIRDETNKWSDVIRSAGVTLQ